MPHRPSTLRRALLLAVALLVAVEVGVARQNWIWAWEPASSTGVIDFMEATVIDPAPDPEIVFLGSSRMRDAVAPRTLEDLLDLPDGTVLNLGVTGGGPFEAQVLYERNRPKLSRAGLVVVGVEYWDLLDGGPAGANVRRFGSLADRLEYQGTERVSLLLGWLWRTYDAKDPIRHLLTDGIGDERVAAPVSPDGRVQWRPPVAVGPEVIDPAPAAERFFADRLPGDGRMGPLRDLLDLLDADGVPVMLVHLPVRDSFADHVEAVYGHVVEHYERTLGSLEGVQEMRLMLRAGDLGLTETDFYDYGHLTTGGGLAMTAHLATVIARLPGTSP